MNNVTKAILVCILGIATMLFTRDRGRVPPLSTRNLNQSYDYIIVGGGTAGSVLANRLTEDPEVTVLLLEAGDEETNKPMYDIPWNAPRSQMTEADWIYRTVPQKTSCLAMKDRTMIWPRGKGLGGSTLVNGLVYIRGSRYDFDGWSANGCEGWSYEDVLPYFIKLEDYQIFDKHVDPEQHGKGGPMVITDTTFSEIANAFLAGGEELGYTVQDCNGNHGDNEVWCRMHAIVGNGMRWTTARGYLYPIRDRKNLHISVKSHVTKVIIEERTAVGVDFIRKGRKERVKASREVILAAGSVGSPQILWLSGIGPKEYLEKLHIPVVADLPVGENLIDHVMFFVKADIRKPVSYTPDKVNTTFNQLMYHFFGTGKPTASSCPYDDLSGRIFWCLPALTRQYDHRRAAQQKQKRGSLTSNAADEANAFLKTNPDSKDKRPDIQFILVSTLAEHGDAVDHFNYRDKVNKELFGGILSSKGTPEGFSVAIALLHPKSRGIMRLRSSDPFDYPEIDPNYLAHKDDIQSILQGIKVFRKLLMTKPMLALNATFRNKPFSGCTTFDFDTDQYWECIIRHFTVTIYHPTTTCKMGAVNDPSTVVDPSLRVKGISGLRVIDASIMPDAISGNTMSASIMIGEKGADLVRNIDSVNQLRKKRK